MRSAVATYGDYDLTDVPSVVRGSVKLGVLEAILVAAFAIPSKYLSGPLELAICGLVLLVGLAAVTLLPGIWTKPRSIEGIAGAAGIGLGAAGVFLLIDVALLQPIGIYTNRWSQIGGGSNWWYHPVWWMAGTTLSWLGAWILANQSARGDRPSPLNAMLMALVFTIVVAVIAIIAHFPGAAWGLGTFGVAFLPGLAIATLVSILGARRT